MVIRFTLKEYNDIQERYWNLLNYTEPFETDEKDGEFFVIKACRVVIPSLGIAFREGEWYIRNEDWQDESEEEGWQDDSKFDEPEPECGPAAGLWYPGDDLTDGGWEKDYQSCDGSWVPLQMPFVQIPEENQEWKLNGKVTIVYDQEESNAENMQDYTTAGVTYSIRSFLKRQGSMQEGALNGDLECYIDTDEFMENDVAERLGYQAEFSQDREDLMSEEDEPGFC